MAKKYSKELDEIILTAYRNGISPYEMVKTIPELKEKRPSVIYGVLKRLNEPVRKKRILTDEQRKSRRKYNCNDSYFSEINTEQKAYWLGFIYADGYITSTEDRVGISLSSKDKSHLEKFKNAVNFDGPIKDYTVTQGYKVGSPYSRIVIASKEMKNDLKKLGVFEKKSTIAVFPNENQVPKKFMWHFARGYFDGNGSITNSGTQKNGTKNYSLKTTGTYSVISGLQNLFGTNIKFEQRHPERNVDNYSFSIGGNKQVLRILNNLYKDSTIYLDRKYDRYKQVLSSVANATENHG